MNKILKSVSYEVDNPLDAIEFCYEKGWTDGLPVVPPTEARVVEFLEYAQLEPDQIVGEIPERNRVVTAEKLAINAVMAGCRKEYMPVVKSATEALCDPDFKFNHLASLGSPWPMMIVSGPIVKELEFNHGMWVLGPGFRPNATIGRTISLIVSNCAKGYIGGIQRGTYGHPGRFNSLCVGENSQVTGWEPHHVEMGFDQNTSTVTLVSTYPGVDTPLCIRMEPEPILEVLSYYIADGLFYRGIYPILMGPPWAEVFVKAGWTKTDMKNWMYEHCKFSVAGLKARRRWGLFTRHAEGLGSADQKIEPGDENKYVYIWKEGQYDQYVFDDAATERKMGIYFVAAGGDSGHRCAIMTPYAASSNPVTKPIKKPGEK